MRVSKGQIARGAAEFIENEILPKMGNDRAVQIILSIAAKTVTSNNNLIDAIMENEIVRAILNDDGTGMYEINGVMDAMQESVEQYGSFPIQVPAIPLLSPHEITLTLDARDVEALRRRIENGV